MSHIIEELTIRNYRSIEEITLHLDKVSPLIGQNNAGKSNILNAIQWFVRPSALDRTDFKKRNEAIEVEAVIVGLSTALLENHLFKEHAKRIEPFVSGERLRIKRVISANETKPSSAKLHVQDPNTGDYKDNPAGLPEALKNLFPEPVRIEAMVNVPDDAARNKSGSTLGKLIGLLTEPVVTSQTAKLKPHLDKIEARMSASGKSRPKELKMFDKEASGILQDYFPGLELKIDFTTPSLSDLLKAGTVKITEEAGSTPTEFAALGHGAQRSIQMALLQLLAERGQNKTVPRCTLLLIDEPELYLHPQAIEQVRFCLNQLAKKGYQVIFSTHSPMMITPRDVPTTNIISKKNQAKGTVVQKRARESVAEIMKGEAPKQARVLFELSNSKEVLFSDRVLLVEGHSEIPIIPRLYEAIRKRSMAADKLGIVKLSSCGDLQKAMKILNKMGIEARGLVDLDYTCVGGQQAGFIGRDDPARKSIADWFQAHKDEHEIVLHGGWPTKKSKGGAEGAFRALAEDTANAASIESLHDQLKSKSIWSWRKGSLEHVLGLTDKNNPETIDAMCEKLERRNIRTLKEKEECKAFCQWLTEEI